MLQTLTKYFVAMHSLVESLDPVLLVRSCAFQK